MTLEQPQFIVRAQDWCKTHTRIVGWLSIASFVVAGFFLFMGTARAADLYTCSATPDSNWTPSANGGQVSISPSAGAVRSVGVLTRCTSSWTFTDGDGDFMSYNLDPAGGADFGVADGTQNIPANTDVYVWLRRSDSSTESGTVSNIYRSATGSIINGATHGCVIRYSSTDQCGGNRQANSGQDMIFRLSDAAGGASDARDSVVSTVLKPEAGVPAFSSVGGVPYRFATSVCVGDYPGESPDAVYDVEKNDEPDGSGSWTDLGGYTVTYDDNPLNQSAAAVGVTCDSGTTVYGFGAIPDARLPLYETGYYRVNFVSGFGGGHPDSDPSDWVEFTIGPDIPYGGGSGGSWDSGGAGSGGATDWNAFLDSAPAAPTCDFWGTADDEGLNCVWTWIRYIIVPPTDGFFDLISQPVIKLSTRWPFAYITNIVNSISEGIGSGGQACPLPSFGGGTYNDIDVDTVSPCEWFDSIGDAVEANATAEGILVTVTYFGLGLAVFYRARKFFSS